MVRFILAWLFCVGFSGASVGQRLIWEHGMTLLKFFNKHHIDPKIYYNLSYQDKELGTEIRAGVPYYALKNDKGQLLQVLVPVGESVQLRLYKKPSGQYALDFIPIIYSTTKKTLSVHIKHSAYHDIFKATGDAKLAQEFIGIYQKILNLKRTVTKGDQLSLIYTRKYRLNQPFGYPNIKAAMLQAHRRDHYVFSYKGKYYDERGREVVAFLLETPVHYTRISSPFSLGRMHPILKQIRPHYGIDFAAKRGSLIHAATDGYIVSIGRRGGYGNEIEIKHGSDLRMVYAHMSAFAKGLHVHSYVKRGQVIGKVGSTGLSTGPHLHFGVYVNDRPVDPLGRIRTAKSQLSGHDKQLFSQAIKPYLKTLEDLTSFEYAQKENTKNTD
ncbi:Membrane proteins related to metalloendopeptidases [Helicobacter heilmannii]|uniref:peptidoglycan DD-metalloendopeptidase family protein n=1 Tax=Helicobacter heilmannii TaxID=35817 RepID=UPI0006A22FCB|nr:peptidoglycan DD-metalloendopeptidase family protein [Helicobacter heilmannii]CRF49235.1 Membrane proteins related to metalloendopeptidases [Helicobacter heilmannii]